MRFARLNGAVIHHELRGAGDATVFINSLGTDFRIWNGVTAALGTGAHLVWDKRGHGLSELTGEVTIEQHAADLAALMDYHGVHTAKIVGLSIGGLIALALQRDRPDLVSSLVLCDTGHKIGTPETWSERIKTAGAQGVEPLADGILDRWFSDRFLEENADEVTGYRAMLIRTPGAGYAASCEAIAAADMTEAAKAVSVPTLCVVGEEDGATPPALMEELTGLIPGARLERIERTGHLPCIEEPGRLAELIANHG